VKKIIEWVGKATDAVPHENMEQEGLAQRAQDALEGGGDDANDDPLYEQAKRIAIESGKASASLLQRRLKIGYARAARLLDILEEKGVVGPADGAKPREVYASRGRSDDGQETWLNP
jgi:DNA segregation ATPase FtsK/SpoIIIE, S-DNA-T family